MKLTRLTALVGAIALVTTACGSGVTETAGSDGANQGIQVHGQWTLDIYNEDGSLDKSIEFENALTSQGADRLTDLLARDTTMGEWAIAFGSRQNSTGLCRFGSTAVPDGFCTGGGGLLDGTVQTSTVDSDSDSWLDTLVLELSMTLAADGQIDEVFTFVKTCDPDVAPESCSGTPGERFTNKLLDPSNVASVTNGQQVQVTVEISFS